jgi:hypothetical protein
MGARLNQIVELAARNSLSVMGFGREFPVAGGLISYGASVPDAFRQAGVDSLAIFGLTLAEQAHLHEEFNHMLIVGDAYNTDAGTESASILPLSDASGCAFHAKTYLSRNRAR